MGADAKTAMKVDVTDAAFRRIAKISAKEGKSALRVSVEGGGCSGFFLQVRSGRRAQRRRHRHRAGTAPPC